MSLTLKTSLTAEWYTFEGQENEESPARVKLKPLNGEQLDNAMEGAVLEGSNAGLSSRGIKSALRNSIVDWEGINSDRGDVVACKFTNHHLLPWARRNELATVIINRSDLSEEQQKN